MRRKWVDPELIAGRREAEMKILGISGSPRVDGNSDAAMRRTLEALGGVGRTEFLRIHGCDIRHCTGCRQCMTAMRCVIEGDDFEDVFDRWKAADVLMVSAPVYWCGPPGAMKDFIDRSHGAYAHKTGPFAGKKAGVVTVATESGFETQERIVAGWLRHYGADLLATVRLYAREKDDLLNAPGELRKLDEFIDAVKDRLE
jgi:multimeric flavodoxin WrbA